MFKALSHSHSKAPFVLILIFVQWTSGGTDWAVILMHRSLCAPTPGGKSPAEKLAKAEKFEYLERIQKINSSPALGKSDV